MQLARGHSITHKKQTLLFPWCKIGNFMLMLNWLALQHPLCSKIAIPLVAQALVLFELD